MLDTFLGAYFLLRLQKASLREADSRQMDSKDELGGGASRERNAAVVWWGWGSAALDGGVRRRGDI